MISIPLHLNTEHPCSYLENRKARFAYIHPEFALTNDIYSQLISQGFRRSGNHVYRPYCANCTQCISSRLVVAEFQSSRQQRRTIKKNADIQVTIKPAIFAQQHYDLYQRYQHHRHKDGEMANTSEQEYINFLGSEWCNTLFVEFSYHEQLVGVAVIDILDNALSAVYTFFDPDFSSRSLGVYAVLWQIKYAKSLSLDWLYLGFWIENCQKMSYKTNYQPLQGLLNEQWRSLE